MEGVTNSDQGSSTIAGKTEKDQAEVAGWIEKIAGGEVPKQDGLKVNFEVARRLSLINF